MFCPKCGTQIQGTEAFCPKCGAPIQKAAPRQPQSTYQQPTYQQPQSPYQQPAYQQPQPTYQQPAYQQSQPTYQQSAYQQSQPTYQQSAYQQPQPTYQQPAYNQPNPGYGYGAPGYGAPAPKKSMKGLIIAIVAILVVAAAVVGILLATGVIGGKSEETGSQASGTAEDGAKAFVNAVVKMVETQHISALAPYSCVDIIDVAEAYIEEQYGSIDKAMEELNSYMGTDYRSFEEYIDDMLVSAFSGSVIDLSSAKITGCEEETGSISSNRRNIDAYLSNFGTSLDECVKNIEDETVILVTVDGPNGTKTVPVYMVKTGGKWLAVGIADSQNWR